MLASNKAISYQLYIEEEKKEVPKYKKDNFSEVLRNKMDRSRQERSNLLGRIIDESAPARNVPEPSYEDNQNGVIV